MFIPISILNQMLPPVNTQEDLIQALDMFVLPHYPDFMTKNPALTKAECFGVVASILQAGKLHLKFKAVEVDKAVDAFLEDRLWVSKAEIAEIELLPNQTPYGYMTTASIARIFKVLVQETQRYVVRMWTAVIVSFKLWYYSFKPERTFKIPRSPVYQDRMANMPTRKNS